ncbi:uncharacterized protein Cpr67B [Chironomus tepperi]|uniref:uncharacterized protein Cpr67B n=1 Tax=Chironomus tepperi TaxID=113505 RepID=UPI00391EE26D
MKLNILLLCLMAVSLTRAAHIQLIDITPEEAQKLITQQSLDLRYSNKIGEVSAAGKSYNGKIIDSDDYTEEVYDANQFHGQDGLGRFVFGHSDNQQTRLEAGNGNGEVRGQYRYIDPWGNDVEVQYWSDSLGFHQTDNRPKFDIQSVTETPEVKAAREEHERLWKEAARLNGIEAESNGYYSTDNDDLEGQVSNQNVKSIRYPILSYDKHISSDNAEEFGDVRDDSVIVEAAGKNKARSRVARQYDNVEEVTSEPRGFFYSFDYAVPFINDHGSSRNIEGQSSDHIEIFARTDIDNKETEDDEEQNISAKIAAGILSEDEVHDTQIHPKQKAQFKLKEDLRQSAKISAGLLSEDERTSAKIHDGLIPEDEVHDAQVHPKQRAQIKPNDEKPKITAGKQFEDEVHDTQVHPKQRAGIQAPEPERVSTRIRDGLAPEDEVHDVQSSPKQKVYRSVNRGRGSIRYKDTV